MIERNIKNRGEVLGFKKTPQYRLQQIVKRERGDEFIVDARMLHEFLNVKSEFRNWIKNRIKKFEFRKGIDFIAGIFLPAPSERIDYLLTISMAKELSMLERNEYGKIARLYFINCEEELNEIKSKNTIEYTNDIDPVIASLEMIKTVRLEQIEMREQQKRLKQKQIMVETIQKTQNSRINVLERHLETKAAIKEHLPCVNKISDRKEIVRLARSWAINNKKPFDVAFNYLYTEILYREGINVKARAKNSGKDNLDVIEEMGMIPMTLSIAYEIFV